MTSYDSPRAGFDMGRVMQRTFEVLGQNLAPFVGLALICIALPQALVAAGSLFAAQNAAESGLGGAYGQVIALGLVGWIVAMVGTYMLQAGVLYAAVSQMNGRTVEFGQMASTGFSFVLPLFGLGILMGLALIVGFVLLIVPGILMSVAWIVAAPAIVIERKSVTESFGRSADLTRDNRWAIFALCLIYGVAYVAISWVVTLLTGGLTGASGVTGVANPLSLAGLTNIVVTPLLTSVVSLIGTTGVAAIYFELRSIKEGVGARELAAVFD
jgi:hypothetical protein